MFREPRRSARTRSSRANAMRCDDARRGAGACGRSARACRVWLSQLERERRKCAEAGNRLRLLHCLTVSTFSLATLAVFEPDSCDSTQSLLDRARHAAAAALGPPQGVRKPILCKKKKKKKRTHFTDFFIGNPLQTLNKSPFDVIDRFQTGQSFTKFFFLPLSTKSDALTSSASRRDHFTKNFFLPIFSRNRAFRKPENSPLFERHFADRDPRSFAHVPSPFLEKKSEPEFSPPRSLEFFENTQKKISKFNYGSPARAATSPEPSSEASCLALFFQPAFVAPFAPRRPPFELLPFSRLLQFRTSANRKLGRARLPAPRAVFLRKKNFSPIPTESKVFGRKGNFARPIRFRKEKRKNQRETGLARRRFSSEGQRPSPERSSTGPARPAIDATGPKPERPLRLALGMDGWIEPSASAR